MNEKLILLVEENPDDILLTQRALKRGNFLNKIIVTHDGAEALHYLFGTGIHTGSDLNCLPAVILLDLKLPKIDGLEVLRKIRCDERTKSIPAVILTSSKEEEKYLLNGHTLGANGYIRKPVEFEKFAEVMHQLGLSRLLFNEPPVKNGNL